MAKLLRRMLAWGMFLGGASGFALSAFGILGRSEPRLTLLLSWGAIWLEGMNALLITGDSD